MFKKFDEKENVSGTTQLKSSVQKGIRTKLMETYPQIESYLDQILPKKDAFRFILYFHKGNICLIDIFLMLFIPCVHRSYLHQHSELLNGKCSSFDLIL